VGYCHNWGIVHVHGHRVVSDLVVVGFFWFSYEIIHEARIMMGRRFEMPQILEKQLHADGTEVEDIETLNPAVESMEDFIRDSGLRMEVLPVHENPYRHPADQATAYHYSCKLINAENRWFVVYFSKGPGLRLWQSPPDEFEASGKPLHVPLVNVGTQYDGPLPPFEGENAEYDENIYTKCSVPAPPNIFEVLDCVANDCYTVEITGVFEGWCNLMRAHIDSIHAKKTFETCSQHRLKLLALLGEELYHRLIHEMDRKVVVPETEEEEEEGSDEDN